MKHLLRLYIIIVALTSIGALVLTAIWMPAASNFPALLAIFVAATATSGGIIALATRQLPGQTPAGAPRPRFFTAESYRLLFEHSPDGILLLDPHDPAVSWPIVDCNDRACTMHGYTRAELFGQSIDLLHPEPDVPENRSHDLQQLRQQRPLRTQTLHRNKDGSLFPIEATTTLITLQGHEYVLDINRSATQCEMLEQSLRRHTEAMQALNNAAVALGSALQIEGVLERIITAANEVFPQAMVVTAQLLEDARNTMQTAVASSDAQETPQKIQFKPGVGIAGLAIQERRVINVPDIDRDSRFVPGALPPNFKSLLVAPLVSTSRIWGTLSIEGRQANTFNQQDEILANMLARQIGTAIENAYLYEAERQQRRIADTLRDIGMVLTGTLSQENVLKRVLEQIGRVLPYDAASLWMSDENGNYRRLVSIEYDQISATDQYLRHVWTSDSSSLLMDVVKTKQAVIASDVRETPRWSKISENDWQRSWAGAPIFMWGQLIGVFCLDHHQPNFYNKQHKSILESLAAQVSLAVENARLFEQVHTYASDLESQVAARTREILQQQERTDAILRNIDDGVLIADLTGLVTYTNQALQRILGWSPADLINRPLDTLLHPSTPPEVYDDLWQTVRQRQPWRGDLILQHWQGQPVEVEVSGVPYRERTGEVVGLIASLRHIGTERILDRMKGQFMTLASHELRTPLTSLKLHTHLLRRRIDDSASRARYLQTLEDETDRLVQLMEKVLSITRLADTRALDISETVSLTSLMDNIQARFAHRAEHKDVHLELPRFPEEYPSIRGDEHWLTKAIFELVENALAHTPAGGQVTVKLVHQNKNTHCLQLQVIDTGSGLPTSTFDLSQPSGLLEQQVETATSMDLGLFIARSVVERHGGTLVVDNIPDRGTTVTVKLPYEDRP